MNKTQEGLTGDLPYLETSLSDQKLDLRILELGFSFVRFEGKFQWNELQMYRNHETWNKFCNV